MGAALSPAGGPARHLTKLERAALEGGALYLGAAALVVAAAALPSLAMGVVIAGVTIQDEAGDGPIAWALTLLVPLVSVVVSLLWLRAQRRRLETADGKLGLWRGALVGALVTPAITAAIWLIGFTACSALVAREPNAGTRYALEVRDGKRCVARVVERRPGGWRATTVVDAIQTPARVDLPPDVHLFGLDELRGKAVATPGGGAGTIDGFVRYAFSPNDALVAGRRFRMESLCLP